MWYVCGEVVMAVRQELCPSGLWCMQLVVRIVVQAVGKLAWLAGAVPCTLASATDPYSEGVV